MTAASNNSSTLNDEKTPRFSRISATSQNTKPTVTLSKRLLILILALAMSSGIAISANHLHSAVDCGSNRFHALWNLFRRSSLSLPKKHRCKKTLNRGHLTSMRLIGIYQKMQRSSHRKISLKRSKTRILIESGNILTVQKEWKRC